jgi:hypothetical protein
MERQCDIDISWVRHRLTLELRSRCRALRPKLPTNVVAAKIARQTNTAVLRRRRRSSAAGDCPLQGRNALRPSRSPKGGTFSFPLYNLAESSVRARTRAENYPPPTTHHPLSTADCPLLHHTKAIEKVEKLTQHVARRVCAGTHAETCPATPSQSTKGYRKTEKTPPQQPHAWLPRDDPPPQLPEFRRSTLRENGDAEDSSGREDAPAGGRQEYQHSDHRLP